MVLSTLFISSYNNSTNSSSLTMSDVIGDHDWRGLAEQLFYDGNATAAIDVFCNTWVGHDSAPKTMNPKVAIMNYAMSKAIGWTIVILLKTIFFEEHFSRWSGASRIINLGTTIIPFGLATWSILVAMSEARTENNSREEMVFTADVLMTLGKHLGNHPGIRNSLLTGFAWTLFHHCSRFSKTLKFIHWIPGIMSGIFSLSCWIFGETKMVTPLIGEDLSPNTLQVFSKFMYWFSNTVTGWYCYAEVVKAVFRTDRFTSFRCFLIVASSIQLGIFWLALGGEK